MGVLYFDNSDIVGMLAIIGVLLILISLMVLAFGIASYVLSSFGVYRIAKRRGIHNPWLAWVPVANSWIMGSISDQYQYLVKGKNTNRRLILLIFAIINAIVGGMYTKTYVNFLGNVLEEMDISPIFMESFLMFSGISLLIGVMEIVAFVFRMMALYDLYSSCKPKRSLLFLVLSIFFNVAQPFFIFSCRNDDGGMPPRKAEYRYTDDQL